MSHLASPSGPPTRPGALDTPMPSPPTSPTVAPRRDLRKVRGLRPPPPSTPQGKKLDGPPERDAVEWEIKTGRMDPLTFYDAWGNAFDLSRKILSPALSERTESESMTRASSMSLHSLWSNTASDELLRYTAGEGVDDDDNNVNDFAQGQQQQQQQLSLRERAHSLFRAAMPHQVSVTAVNDVAQETVHDQGHSDVASDVTSETSLASDDREDWERDIAAWRKGQKSHSQRQLVQPRTFSPLGPVESPGSVASDATTATAASNNTAGSKPSSVSSSVRVRRANSEGPMGLTTPPRRSSTPNHLRPEDRGGQRMLRRINRRNLMTVEQLRAAEEKFRRNIAQSEDSREREAVRMSISYLLAIY
jgi:hypothetical protein